MRRAGPKSALGKGYGGPVNQPTAGGKILCVTLPAAV